MNRETDMPSSTPIWAGLSADDHEFHYNPQRAFPDFAKHQATRAGVNQQARSGLKVHADVRYGDHALHTLDIYPAQATAGQAPPVHLFFHGGYWRAQDKQNFAFIAGALVPLGITTIVANYELCPASTLDGVVDSALAAFEWTCRHAGEYGGDARRISMSGHSAGAHLAAEILATDWSARGVDDSVLTGATLISGIFDPAPTILTTVNQQLLLDAEIAGRHDVERRPSLVNCPATLIVGGLEPIQWIDQSFRYSHHLRRQGRDPAVHVLPGEDHFGILGEYLVDDSVTLRAVRGHAARR
jgi:arylformamidase